MEFKRLEIADIGLIKPYFMLSRNRACDNTVGGAFMWRDYFNTVYAVIKDTVVFKVDYYDGKTAFTLPLGSDIHGACEELEKYVSQKQIPLVFCTVTEAELELLSVRYEYVARYEPCWSDYIYNAEELKLFRGQKYHGQKNHLNNFFKNYPEHSFEPINESNIKEIRVFFDRFDAQNAKPSEIFAKEERKVREVLENYGAYGMSGCVLTVGGSVVGFSVGEAVGDTVFVHIEKADRNIVGAYQALVSGFLKMYAGNGIIYVNREEDVGDEGLRTSKNAYKPCALLKKYTVTVTAVK